MTYINGKWVPPHPTCDRCHCARMGGNRICPADLPVHTRNYGPSVDTDEDTEDALVTPGELAAWSAVLGLLAFLAVILAALAAFHLIASIY